ncbi:hypothetical protein BDQ17DRAFT_1431390 [Cyathus striatus]|nr:hypothetical protein BDQ17DRAFT_1431390 [Cyathus striatus]
MRLLPPPPSTQALASDTFRPPPLDGSLTLPEIYDWHMKNTPNHRLFVYAAKMNHATQGHNRSQSEAPVIAILAASDTISYFVNLMLYFVPALSRSLFLLEIQLRLLLICSTRSKFTIFWWQGANFAGIDSSSRADRSQKRSGRHSILLAFSGSTAFPKPISWSNYRAIQLAVIPYFGEQDLTGQVLSLHSMPMYHGMGILQLFWTAASGLVISAFEPKCPATIPTPERLFKDVVATNSDIVFCVPAFVEAWSRTPDYVKWLAGRNGILFGGGPLNKEAGDAMVSQGVSIYNLYGFSEAGILSPILPKKGDNEWEYIRFTANSTPKMVPYDNNVFELVLPSSTFCTPSVVNYTLDRVECYASSDLFEPHPTRPGYWKTNPGPLENILNQDPHVQSSVMFGRGRFQAGVLIDPKPQFKFDDGDDVQLSQFRNLIWPTIVKMNEYAPHIQVTKSSKPFQYTAKNTARRQAMISDYDEEIDALYETVKISSQPDIPHPTTWEIASITDFVRSVVQKVMMSKVKDSESIFDYGCDSLQATWIRNTLLRAARDFAKVDTRKSTDNFVYTCRSIANMASFIHAMASAKYTAKFPIHVPSLSTSAQSDSRVQLVADPAVSRIYAFNRPRQQSKVLQSEKVHLVEADLSDVNFRIQRQQFYEIRAAATHIIHNAWPVNFNLSLQSFETSIAGLRRLIDFCLTSPRGIPPKLIFTSTIGVFRKSLVPAEVSIGTGYSESKWVSEQILNYVSQTRTIQTTIVRVGQLSGGPNGSWNGKEWFPSMVQASKALGALPLDDKLDDRPPSQPNPIPWATVASQISSLLSLSLVPYMDWLERLEKRNTQTTKILCGIYLL